MFTACSFWFQFFPSVSFHFILSVSQFVLSSYFYLFYSMSVSWFNSYFWHNSTSSISHISDIQNSFFNLHARLKWQLGTKRHCTVQILFVWQIKVKLELPTTHNDCLTAMNQLLVALRFYATGSFQLMVGDTFGVSKSTVCQTVHRVTEAIAALSTKYIQIPSTMDKQKKQCSRSLADQRCPAS